MFVCIRIQLVSMLPQLIHTGVKSLQDHFSGWVAFRLCMSAPEVSALRTLSTPMCVIGSSIINVVLLHDSTNRIDLNDPCGFIAGKLNARISGEQGSSLLCWLDRPEKTFIEARVKRIPFYYAML